MSKIISLLAVMLFFFSGSTKHEILDGVYFIIRHEKKIDKEIPRLYYSPHNFILIDSITVYYHNDFDYIGCIHSNDYSKPSRLNLTPDSLIEIKIEALQTFLDSKFAALDSFGRWKNRVTVSSPTDTIRTKAYKILADYLISHKIDNQLRNCTEEELYVSMAKAQHKEYNPDSIDWKVGFDEE